jgi:hypothetical protein
MTVEEVEATLPNGFHDAEILEITFDAISRSLQISLNVDIHDAEGAGREIYRAGKLTVQSAQWFSLGTPDPRYPFTGNGEPLNASGFSIIPGRDARVDALLAVLPAGFSAYGFFLDDWNSDLYFAGKDPQFLWDEASSGP